jgi:hypothetical protein
MTGNIPALPARLALTGIDYRQFDKQFVMQLGHLLYPYFP